MQYFMNAGNKTKAIALLFVIICFVMISNLAERQDFEDLDRTVSSIYQDRLKPAGYIFRLNDLLHEKLNSTQTDTNANDLQQRVNAYNAAITSVIAQYEKTYLTKAEKLHWQEFKTHLKRFDKAESQLIAQSLTGNRQPLLQSFTQAQSSLNKLNALQLEEGNVLQMRSRSIIGGSILNSYLDTSLLFILGITVVIIVTTKGRRYDVNQQNPIVN